MNAEEKVTKILARLGALYPEPRCALHFGSNFQLLIAVILSAQCTDARVNIVTEKLFAVADTPQAILSLGYDGLVGYIYSTGFYRNKANNILRCCAQLLEEYNGIVPSDREQLKQLAGVGEKTANVVFAEGFGGQAIPVDTHVGRLARRLGLSREKDPTKVMHDLERVVPQDRYTDFHHYLITHGRQVCASARPKCDECVLKDLCAYALGGETTCTKS